MRGVLAWWLCLFLPCALTLGVLTHRAESRPATESAATGETAWAGAQRALRESRWNEAADLLRRTLDIQPDHHQAAARLRSLYDRRLVSLGIDERAVDEARAQLGPEFRRSTTEHFVLLSDCDLRWTRAKARLLERTYRQFFRVMRRMGLEAVPPGDKMLCILFNDHVRYRAFAQRTDGIVAPWIAGYYTSLSNRVVFYNDETGPSYREARRQLEEYESSIEQLEQRATQARRQKRYADAEKIAAQARTMRAHYEREHLRIGTSAVQASSAKTIHEASHLIAFNCGLQTRTHEFPFWLTEGLATCFETGDPDTAFGPDETYAPREREIAELLEDEQRLVPLGALVQMTDVPGGSGDTAEVMYSQAYAFFRYAFRFEREQLAGLFRDIAAETPGRISPRRHLELFRARFGDPDSVEQRWLRWERSRQRTQLAAGE